MLKDYYNVLKSTADAFKGNRIQLIFMIFIRGISLSLTPLIVPITMQLLFNAIEVNNNENLIKVCCLTFIYIIPTYIINYLICYFSDVWVIDKIYSWMKKNVEICVENPYMEKFEKYSVADISNGIIKGSFAGVQAWIHLFRLLAPVISALVLAGFILSYSWLLLPALIIVSILDLVISNYDAKKRKVIFEKLFSANIKREESIRELVYKIEYIAMNEMFEDFFYEYEEKRRDIWLLEKRHIICTILVGMMNSAIEKLSNCFLSVMMINLKCNSKISVGAIGAINTNYSNYRNQIIYTKNQISATLGKVEPVKRLDEIKNIGRVNGNCDNNMLDNKVVKLENITFTRDNRVILDGINLEVGAGEKVAIIGKNGCGKSTLLRMIIGLYKADSGSCIVFGKNKDMENNISYAPSSVQLFGGVSVTDNILMGSIEEVLDENSKQMYCDMELKDFSSNLVHELSVGQAQRVSLIRAYNNNNAKLYVYDEPTSGLDEMLAHKVMKNIIDKSKNTVIYVTHNPRLLKYASRIVFMQEGRIMFDGTLDNCVNNNYYLEWADSQI